MYHAALAGRVDIEDREAILDVMDGLLDRGQLGEALAGGLYEDQLSENNRLVWDEYGLPAVPSYRRGGKFLKSIPGVGVTKLQLKAFLK